ncbi:MAG TPA: 6-bladed beta-propeller [Bryobacteraceae bacterium]|nr:6-bladed beta-propeller [Bryobacteraceae bacterium]
MRQRINDKTQVRRRKSEWAVAALALLVALPLAAGNKRSKNAKADPGAPQRITIDTRNLVWPQPPEIARVKFLAMYTGEKFDPSILEKARHQKRNWKDVLAGAQSQSEKNTKIPLQFMRVYGVASDSKGNIYAADQAVGAVFIIDPVTRDAQVIGNGKQARFGLINGLAMDDDDRLFVSDSRLHHVLVFNSAHEQAAVVGGSVLADPGGLAIDRENRFLYVVDTSKDQVVVFDADNYKVLRTIGVTGKKHTLTDPGNFSLPTNAAVDNDGNLYVTDTLNNRVEIFDAEGNFISEFGKAGDGPGRFARPKGIAVDGDGHIWVVDEVQSRVQVFDRNGRLLIYFGEQGPYPGQFQAAYGIAIDKRNRVIVSEQFPGRVQVFQYVTDGEAEEARRMQAGEESTREKAPVDAQGSAAHAPR